MSRGRQRRAEVEALPASTSAFWSLLVNGLFVAVFAASLGGFVYLVAVGWWRSPLELLVAAVLLATAAVGLAFFADGIRRDLRDAGWSARGELRAIGQRFRRRPGGKELFASQRFTSGKRRRRQ